MENESESIIIDCVECSTNGKISEILLQTFIELLKEIFVLHILRKIIKLYIKVRKMKSKKIPYSLVSDIL